MFRRILFVCIGNICRSPMAEIVMRDALRRDDVTCASAGLQALDGHPIDPMAAELMRGRGLDPDAHRARQLTPAMLAEADLVLVMERAHHARILREAPQASGKVLQLGKWRGDIDIPDPYRQQRPAFEHVLRLVDDCVAGWRPYIR
ncbi:low molecular weight phosphotyrosine protein phosphatase [Luteimonas sp. BDR2-5]|uniref:low molecular weight protein-tyrosine-phosphatase n=1 Tax=Proluteimonas luteida TaxID=2878685 RepID=UPI001E46BF5F|nr:low molecular weight phosphotyrosine protein phosphatase [Luteimonas sp. BDR2-5]